MHQIIKMKSIFFKRTTRIRKIIALKNDNCLFLMIFSQYKYVTELHFLTGHNKLFALVLLT